MFLSMKSNQTAVEAKKVPEAFIRIIREMVDEKFCRPNGFTLEEVMDKAKKRFDLRGKLLRSWIYLFGISFAVTFVSLIVFNNRRLISLGEIIVFVAVAAVNVIYVSLGQRILDRCAPELPKYRQEVYDLLKTVEDCLGCVYEKYPFLEETLQTEVAFVRAIEVLTCNRVREIDSLQSIHPEWKRKVKRAGTNTEVLDNQYLHLRWLIDIIIRLELVGTDKEPVAMVHDMGELYRVRADHLYEKLFSDRDLKFISG